MDLSNTPRSGQRLFLAARRSGPSGSVRLRQMQALAHGAVAAGVEAVVLHERGDEQPWGDALAIPAFDPAGRPVDPTPFGGVEPPRTLDDFDRAVRFDPPRAGDHILFQCATAAELAALLEALLRRPAGLGPALTHLVLRGEPDADALAMQQPVFDRVALAPRLFRTLALHADDDAAAAEYLRLTGLRFGVLPVPVGSTIRLPVDAVQSERAEQAGRRRLSIRIHADDAETSLAEIGSVVAALWRSVFAPGLARVTVIEPARPGSAAAARRLRAYPPARVRLASVADEGARAPVDIVVAGRDSAASVEAAAAGLPVLAAKGGVAGVAAASVYATASDLARLLTELVADYDTQAASARTAASALRMRHDGEAVVRTLLTASPCAPPPRAGRPEALCLARKRDALGAVDALAAAGFGVTLVFRDETEGDLGAALDGSVPDGAAAADTVFVLPQTGGSDELDAHLAAHPPQVAWVSRPEDIEAVARLIPTRPPIVCELRDHPSAAMEGSQIEGAAAIVAPSEHVAEQLASAAVTAPVVVSRAAPAPRAALHLLAGCTDLGEVLAACRPTSTGAAASRAKLAAMKTLDLVIDGGDGAPDDLAGIGWFLDEVYAPRLAPAGVTLAVLGAVASAAAWPELPGVLFTGPLADASPLRAAARLEVVPVVGGPGQPWRVLEAAAGGRPVVATSAAVLGLLEAHPGVHVRDGAEATAGLIHHLLGSVRDRAAGGGRADEDDAYPVSVRAALAAAIGTELSAPEPKAAAAGSVVEWDDDLRGLNRIVRTWSEGGWPLASDLALAAALPRSRVQAALQAILPPLAEGSAPVLLAEPGLRRRAVRHGPISSSDGAAIVLAAVDLLANRRPQGGGATLLFDGTGALDMAGRVDGGRRTAVWAADPTARIQLHTSPDATDGVFTLRRGIVAPTVDVQVERGEFSSAGVVLRQGVRVRIRPPLLAAPAGAARWLELEIDEFKALELVPALDGRAVRAEECAAAGRRRLRIPLDRAASPTRDGLAERLVTLDVVAGVGLLTAMSTRVALDGGELDALVASGPATAGTSRSELTTAVAAGEPATATALAAARMDPLGPHAAGASVGFWETPVDPEDIDAVLAPARWATSGPGRFVASPGLSIRCEAVFEDQTQADAAGCTLDGAPGAPMVASATTRVWTWPGREPGEAGWRRELRLAQGSATPLSLSWSVNLPGGFDEVTGDRVLARDGFYGQETQDGRTWSWTGPEPLATLRIPLAMTAPGRLVLRLVGPGDLDLPSALGIRADSRELELAPLEGGLGVSAELPGAADGFAVLELQMQVASLFDPPGDPRRLGVAVSEVELRFPL